MTVLTQYANLNVVDKAELFVVATNTTFQNLLLEERAYLEDELLKLSPGSDTVQFMLDYAVAQANLNKVVDYLELLKLVREEYSKQSEET